MDLNKNLQLKTSFTFFHQNFEFCYQTMDYAHKNFFSLVFLSLYIFTFSVSIFSS